MPKDKYKDGDLMYICPRSYQFRDGFFAIYRGKYQGDKDLSYHGSPWYEDFISCEDINTGNITNYGNQSYDWRLASDYISMLQDVILKVYKMTHFGFCR